MTFLKELMRRNVIKVGAAYVIVGWLLIQGASILLPAFGAPDWSEPVFYALVIAGLPIALIVAWAFELTPQGVRRTEALATPPPESVPTDGAPRPATNSTVPSIAVLPFVDMSPDKDQEYFSDGLSEELLNKLARLKGLQVAGRTSSFHFKGRNEDLRVIGETLGVANVLEGSVRKSGDQVRITAQLINARDGYHLWTETYDRKFDDIFAIQDEIAEGVAKALSVTLGVGDMVKVEGMTRNVEAYEAYLLGKPPLVTGRLSHDLLRDRIDSLERAVRLDPSFALAWARLALQYSWFIRYDSPGNVTEWQRKADRALARAVELAPNAAEVLSQSAEAATVHGNWTEAERIYGKALSLHGETSLTFAYTLFLLAAGKISKAVDYLVEARRIEPLEVGISVLLAVAYDEAGRTKDALAECDRGDAIGEPETHARGVALMVVLATDDRAEIRRRLDRLIEIDEITGPMHAAFQPLLADEPAALAELRRLQADPAFGSPQHLLVVACWAAYFGDPALALRAWQGIHAGAGLNSLLETVWMQLFRDMRRLPGFKDLLRELGLVDYWRRTGDWGDFCHPVGDEDFDCS
jgi:TolB-like protein